MVRLKINCNYILIIFKSTFCRLKIRQPFLNMEKHGRIDWSDKKFREEFDWIVDVIKRHTRVMELVQNNSLSEIVKNITSVLRIILHPCLFLFVIF